MASLPSSPALNSGSRPRTFWWLVAIVVAVAASYAATPSFDFTNYDDNIYVSGNRHLQGGLTVGNVRWAFSANLLQASREAEYWQPVTNVSRLIDVTLFGLAPGGHHLQSLVLHAVNACLVFWLFLSLSRSSSFSGVSALLFAVHPLNAEAVCWLAARKDLLLGTGSLLTLLAYVWFARGPSLSRYLIALLAYLFALMAKPSAIALPIGFLLLDAWPLGRFSESIRMFRSGDSRPSMVVMAEKAPFFLLALLTAACATWALFTARSPRCSSSCASSCSCSCAASWSSSCAAASALLGSRFFARAALSASSRPALASRGRACFGSS